MLPSHGLFNHKHILLHLIRESALYLDAHQNVTLGQENAPLSGRRLISIIIIFAETY